MNYFSQCAPRLVEERKKLKLTQEQAADIAKVSRRQWGKYERGETPPGGDVFFHLAEAGMDLQYIMTGHRTPRSEEGLDEREKAVLDNFRSLPKEDQASVQRLTYALKESVDRAGEKVKKEAG